MSAAASYNTNMLLINTFQQLSVGYGYVTTSAIFFWYILISLYPLIFSHFLLNKTKYTASSGSLRSVTAGCESSASSFILATQ